MNYDYDSLRDEMTAVTGHHRLKLIDSAKWSFKIERTGKQCCQNIIKKSILAGKADFEIKSGKCKSYYFTGIL